MATYTKPRSDADVYEFLDQALRKWHPELVQAEVTIGILSAWPSENETSAVKLHGYPCAAVVKITPYRQRVQGIEDAVITIDGPAWKDFADAERLALVDHELVHLEVARDDEGHIKSDDHGRPKLRMRLHDVQTGWFMEVAERHGEASFEVKQARDIQEKHGQLLFSFAEGPPPLAKVMKMA